MKDKRFNNVEMLKENRRELEYIRYDMNHYHEDIAQELIPVDPEEFERIMLATGYTHSGFKVN